VLRRAQAAGVAAVIVTGCNLRSSEAARKLCSQYRGEYPLYFTAGVHPHNAKVPLLHGVAAPAYRRNTHS
jgi:Tat protein secretion system quality control protein TatD with DNase activity